jgi:error-prone DNA polymerase
MSYAELHCKTNYSFLVGASHPDELVDRAVELQYAALAITDEQSLAGVVRAFGAARQKSLKLIIGAEITPQDAPRVVLWAPDRSAYGRLCKLLTVGRRRAEKGQCRIGFADIAEYAAGLLAGVIPEATVLESLSALPLLRTSATFPLSVAGSGEAPVPSPLPGEAWGGVPSNPRRYTIAHYRELFGDRGYLLAELYRGSDDARRLGQLRQLSRQASLPLVAAGDVLYHSPARMPLHDVLTATKHHTTVAMAGELLLSNAHRHLHAVAERRRQFAAVPDALARTMEVADRCTFDLGQLKYEYPDELAPAGLTPMEYLRRLTWEGALGRYPAGVPDKVRGQLAHELRLIDELRYEAYFLTVWDLVRFARLRGILCQGRGSAANSAVCYCLGVTSVDPNATDLLFERFISRERNEAPDIDVDFEHERREEVLQYLYEKYGRDRAGLAATVITYRTRSAIRDVGKALGLSLDRVDALAKQVDGYHHVDDLAPRCTAVGLDPASPLARRMQHLVDEILGFPRHLSQHVGGMVITQGPLDELVPIENASMDGRTVIQWDKDDLEVLGLLKVDCLCLGMLSAIRKCFQMVEAHWGRSLTLASVPQEDPLVYDMICRADTVGVFQIESRGQMSMLPRLKPRCWYDLVIEVAIVRPGPIQGNMVHPYLRRRAGLEQVNYPNDEIKAVLHRTLGVPIFQEQAMRLAIVAAGFTPGEADQLRRAMGAWRKSGVIETFREKLMTGMRARGLTDEFAEQVFRQLRGFGEYGFPESHAASFALLVYVSAWLKRHYPAAFTASILNSLPMGFYAPAQLVADLQRHGVEVRPVDVNHSNWDCTLEPVLSAEPPGRSQRSSERILPLQIPPLPSGDDRAEELLGDSASDQLSNSSDSFPSPAFAVRLGLRLISGLPQSAGDRIVAARGLGSFTSVADFTRRTHLGQSVLARLSHANAFQSLDQDRRAALWQSLGQEKTPIPQPLFDRLAPDDDTLPPLDPISPPEHVFADYDTVGLSLRAHPISFYRRQLDEARITPAAELVHVPDGRIVRVAGLVIVRQRPSTAKGITFVTLEDETGTANLVVKQEIWTRYAKIARTSPAWIAHGKLEKRSGVIHVVAYRLEDLSSRLSPLNIRSRDFR